MRSNSWTRPTWRIWLIARLGRLRKVTNVVPVGLPLTIALVIFVMASTLCRPFVIAVAVAGVVLILQEITEPTPLFWTVPWGALEFVLSCRVRVNHVWLHRTEELVRESGGCLTEVDGVATREGFFRMGTSLSENEIQWASQCAWRTIGRTPSAMINAPACKTMQFLLALCMIAVGLTVLSLWHGVNLWSGLLLAAVSGGADQLLAKPIEKPQHPRAADVSCSNSDAGHIRLEVESLAIPEFLWFKKGRVFQVRRMPLRESNGG